MKVFALINDGYHVVYHEDISIVEDWKYIYQEHFAILKIFEIEVPNEEVPVGCDLFINFSFNKRDIAQDLSVQSLYPRPEGLIPKTYIVCKKV